MDRNAVSFLIPVENALTNLYTRTLNLISNLKVKIIRNKTITRIGITVKFWSVQDASPVCRCVLVPLCPSVRMSVRPSVLPSVRLIAK